MKKYGKGHVYISMAQYLDELESKKMNAWDFIDKAVFHEAFGVELRREPWPEYKEQLVHIKEYAAQRNIKIVFATNSTLFPRNEENEKLLYHDIDIAAIIGAPLLRVFPGKKPDENELLSWEKAKATISYAQSKGVKIALENGGGNLPSKLSFIKSVLDKIQNPTLGTNLDIGNYFLGNQDIASAAGELKDRIICTHIKDIDTEKNSTYLGGGIISLPGVFEALDTLSEELIYIFEFDGNGQGDMRIRKSMEYMGLR